MRDMVHHHGRLQDTDLTAAEERKRDIVLGKRALWLWLATLGMFAIALVVDHLPEQGEPPIVAFLSSFP